MNFKELQRQIASLNKNLDSNLDKIIKLVDSYQSDYEKYLLKQGFDLNEAQQLKSTIRNYNKAQSLTPMNRLGFNDLATEQIKVYDDIAKNQLLFNKRIGITADIGFRDLTLVNQLKQIDLSVFQQEAQMLDTLVKKQLVNAIALNADYKDTVDNLAKDLLGAGGKEGQLARYANTYMRTALFTVTRAVDKEIYDSIGAEKFVYSGALDGRTRDFCSARVGRVFTREEIENFPAENGSGLDGFSSPGGWNCRHRMIPVLPENEELAESIDNL